MMRFYIQVCVLSWIYVQDSHMKSTTVHVFPKEMGCMRYNHTLQCEGQNTIVIDSLFYVESTDGDTCNQLAVDCNVTKQHEYLVHERCLSAHNVCDLKNLPILQLPPCLDGNITSFCIAVMYSCVQDGYIRNMCSDFTEETSGDLFLRLDRTEHMSHTRCSCNIPSATTLSLTVREFIAYDDRRNCTQTALLVSFPGEEFLFAGCNETFGVWPYYSLFNEMLIEEEYFTNAMVNLYDVVSGSYPAILIQLHGNFTITCKQGGTVRPFLPTTGPPYVSNHSRPNSSTNMLPKTTPVDVLMTTNPCENEVTETATPDLTTPSMETTNTNLTEDDDVIYIASSIGGVCVIVGSAVFVFILVCRRRRLSRLKTNHIQLQQGRDNPYYSPCGGGGNKNTPNQYNKTTNIDVRSDTDSVCPSEHSQWQQSRHVRWAEKQQANINVKLNKQENKYATPRIERQSPILEKTADPSDSASAYDHITDRINKPTSDIYSYDHLRKDTEVYHTAREKDTDYSDETYDHLGKAMETYHATHDRGINNADETYDHLGKAMKTHHAIQHTGIDHVDETYDHLNTNPTNVPCATPAISDDYNSFSEVDYAYDNSFGEGKYSTNTGMDNYDHVEMVDKLYNVDASVFAPNKATSKPIDKDRKFNITEPCRKGNVNTNAETTSFVNPGKAKTEDTTPTCHDQKNLNHQYFILEPKV